MFDDVWARRQEDIWDEATARGYDTPGTGLDPEPADAGRAGRVLPQRGAHLMPHGRFVVEL